MNDTTLDPKWTRCNNCRVVFDVSKLDDNGAEMRWNHWHECRATAPGEEVSFSHFTAGMKPPPELEKQGGKGV